MNARHTYSIKKATSTFVLISDSHNGLSVTNAAKDVLANLNEDIEHGLGKRKVYYQDSTGRFDELRHDNGVFKGFSPCSPSQ